MCPVMVEETSHVLFSEYNNPLPYSGVMIIENALVFYLPINVTYTN
jgi:hypothetical protein